MITKHSYFFNNDDSNKVDVLDRIIMWLLNNE